ncbi:MAG: HypC/HybG/HupF family hydrogenase formation chaperone [Meiothermus sp.]|nr:HypC/HybG/HupF family hydrogenase formation chaperone [Meiothermus sp.]
MCLAIPGKVVGFQDEFRHFATVEVSGVRRQVNMDLLAEERVEVGEWVLIHVGFAMSKISEQEAQDQIKFMTMLGEAEAALEELQGYQFAEEERSPHAKG